MNKKRDSKNGLPPSVDIFPKLKPPHRSFLFHQISVLLITFIAYASFHASRKPCSIVKSVLGPPPPDHKLSGWPPFNAPSSGTHRLGELDLAFLSSYALAMFFSGHFADTLPLRFFLLSGMLGSGFLTILFGLGYWLDVHRFSFFVIVQLLSGLFQSIGWPCVVSIVANWFGKSKRGLIMGLWNSHTSVGNIIGSLLASSALEFGWGWSFLLPGAFIIFVSLFVFFFLIVSPLDLGFQSTTAKDDINVMMDDLQHNHNAVPVGVGVDVAVAIPLQPQLDSEEATLLEDQTDTSDQTAAIGFFEAWRLPGVAPFAFSLFFSKLVAYTFLYWLPFYIRHTAVAGVHLSHKTAGILSTIFDIGGVFGGVLAGYISDLMEARAVTSIVFLFLSIPALVLYRVYGSITMYTNILLMFLSGLLVNGPYSLITTAVAADLGTQSCIKGNSRALATVTAIIDGTGSVGAALGPLLAGYISTRGWNSVFSMLIFSIFLAGLFLIRIAKSEIKNIIGEEKWFRYTIPTS